MEIAALIIGSLVAIPCLVLFIAYCVSRYDEKHKSERPNYFNVNISEEFFNEVKKTVTPFADLLHRLLVSDFYGWLDRQQLPTAEGTEVYQLTRDMILADIKTAFAEMGNPGIFKSKEGLAIMMAANVIYSDKELEFSRLRDIKDNALQPLRERMEAANKVLNQENDNTLVFANLLKSFDSDMFLQYLIALYRFLSVAAKADEVVTEQESTYLTNLLNRAQDLEQHVNEAAAQPSESNETNYQSELDSLIGLEAVKKEVQTLTNFIKIQQKRAEHGLKSSSLSYHCVFTGNPGTGKTTVARIVAGIYKELGVLKKGHLVETDRSGLVAEFIGQTAVKTNDIIDSALDGVLFIDEAYALADGGDNDYGKEAIATLLKRMEDERDRLVVILAGYTENMKHFIQSNPGLQSRFNRYIDFPDYTVDELLQIYEFNMRKYDYHFSADAQQALRQFLQKTLAGHDVNYGNGRFVRNIFEKALERQANRLASQSHLTTERLSALEKEDIL